MSSLASSGQQQGCALGREHPPVPWPQALARAVRRPEVLCEALGLSVEQMPQGLAPPGKFSLFVPWEYVRRMQPGRWNDPLLVQVWPAAAEAQSPPGFVPDPVGDLASVQAPGLLHKYRGRALMILSPRCAVHCRYCFRRVFPYEQMPRSLGEFEPALAHLAKDPQVEEVIWSGGDPLVRPDEFLAQMVRRLEQIPHLRRLRIHTRVPVVIPQRVCSEMLTWMQSTRLKLIVVLHVNHPQELDESLALACRRLRSTGALLFNQAVLLRGVNDRLEVLEQLCLGLVDQGVVPYYLHQLDRVEGAAHFEVPVEQGRWLIRQLRARLPGYAVPRYVQEQPGQEFKLPLDEVL